MPRRRPRRTRDPRAPREPRTRTRIKFLRILFVVAGLTFLSGVSVVFGMMMAVAPDVKRLSARSEFKTAKNSTLTDRKGNFLAELTSDEGRVILDSKGIAPVMKQAVVAIEDRRFYQHNGVDLRGVARALSTDILQGKAAQGASTIEQQFIKVVSKAQDERTIPAKIRETALAYHLSHKWSKQRILTEYLNAIYYGNGAYGIESAARTYFSHDPAMAGCGKRDDPCASHLRPAQAALLAGIINSPTAFDPVANPIDAQKRRDIVLGAMRDQGMLNPVQYSEALSESIPTVNDVEPPKLRLASDGDGYFVGWISAQLVERLHARTAFEGGLRVQTTLDPDLQTAAESAIGAWLTGGGPTAAMAVIDNGTGEVRAMVGGQDFEAQPFNIATQGRRQPGSSFKPFVLAQALREGISPNSIWDSKKIVFPVNKKTGEKFTVNNYDDVYTGPRTLASATAFSDNSVFAQVGIKVGTKKIAKLAEQMGIRTPVSSNLAITLGAPKVGITPLDLAHSYETFATGGKLVSGTLSAPDFGPVGIRKIDSTTGSVKPEENDKETKRILPTSIADETTNILQGVVKIGSGKVASIPGHTVWGKTGTTENYGDAWFAGSTEDLTAVVWVGYPNKLKPMLTEYRGEAVSGGTFPAQIWHTFMLKALSIEQARHDAICKEKAKTKHPCAKDVKPTTPATTPEYDYGTNTGSTTPTGGGTTGGGGATGGGATTTQGGTGGGTGATGTGGTGTGTGTGATGGTGGTNDQQPAPQQQQQEQPKAADPNAGAGTGGGNPTGGTAGAGGVAPGT